MTITVKLGEIKRLIMDAATLGVAEAERRHAPAKDLISQREAYRLFNQTRVKRWVNDCLISPRRLGTNVNSKRFYSYAELLALSQAEQLRGIINRPRL